MVRVGVGWARLGANHSQLGRSQGAPFIHAIGVLFLVGYTIDYNMHLKVSMHRSPVIMSLC